MSVFHLRTVAILALSLGCASAFAQTGTVKSEGQPLPGATIRATQGDRVLTTITDANGAFVFDNKLTPGMWNFDVAMFGFDAAHREVQVGNAPTKIDFTLQLRTFAGGFGRGEGPGGLQNRNANPNNTGLDAATPEIPAAAAEAPADSGAAAANPGGANPNVNAAGANESFLVNGSLSTGLQTQASDFAPFPGGPVGLNAGGPGAAANGQVPGQGPQPGVQQIGPGGGFQGGGGGFGGGGFGGGGFGGGGRGGGGGFGGGGGGRGGGRGGPDGPGGRGAFIGNRRNAGRNQVRGSLFYTFANSALNAAPFSLNGQPNTKAAYAQNRFGFNLGGPLEIPKLFRLENTFFFINYTGNLVRNGVNLTGTVPTLAERAGDFSGLPTSIYMPSPAPGLSPNCVSATPVPFLGNQVPTGCISSIASGLLKYIPVPNQPGTVNNYRLITATPSNSQALNARVNQTLSKRDTLGVAFNWQGRNAISPQLFGFTDSSSGNGFNSNVNWRHNFGGRLFNNFTLQFNRNTSVSTPFFANGPDIAAELGIQGTSTNPINFGPPNLSFTNFGSLSDGSPAQSAIYNLGFTESLSVRKGKHNWTFGGGYTRYFNNTVTDANGRGTFTFTGLSTSALDSNGNPLSGTGYDFADFLLGLPQNNSIRYGSSSTYFRSYGYNAFGQDDWRVSPNLTLNLGLRYEFFSPWTEKYNRIANLDIAPGFTAVAVVTPGAMGPYSGVFPSGLVQPDRNNFAPRTGLAWKPWSKRSAVVRLGYGWYYNPGVYNQFMSRLSAQPPFATSTAVNTSVDNPLTLASGLTVTPEGKTILNTYAVNPNYRDMYAQTWNVSVQTNLPGALVGELAYLGTKGTRLDVQELPNQAPPGSPLTAEQRLLIGNATGFTYDTPVGNSIYHAAQARLTRRFRRGLSFNFLYTFAKSIDDSSTLGGAGNTVAQNFYDLSAERGLSSFDRRHNLTANWVWTSPVGNANGLLSSHRFFEKALKDWTVSGGITLQSGTPLTARVLGNQSDIAGTGNIGSGRAEATGLPVDGGSGFFDLLAFTTPPSGQFGDAGRNTIPGPWSFTPNLSLQRTILITERMRLQIRADGTNVFNHVSITGFGTVVNSQTYGIATSAGAMRALSFTLRLNF